MTTSSSVRGVLKLEPDDKRSLLNGLNDEERRKLEAFWEFWARPGQLPPPGDWHTWLICAGRGYGKTRAGAEWIRWIARTDSEARIALVGASLAEVRSVMIEGESGILAISPQGRGPVWEPSLRRLSWASGAQAYCYSAGEPESLRGPQHGYAWCASAEGSDRQ